MGDRANKKDKPKNKLGTWLLPCLAVAAVTAFPAAFLYCRNAAEVGFSEAAPFLFGSVGVGLALFAGLAALTKKPGKAALAVSLFMFLMMNFSYAEKAMKLVLPSLKYWHTVPIVVVAALHIIYFLWRFMKDGMAKDASAVLCLVFGGLILINVATAAPQILRRAQVQRQLAAEEKAAESAQAAAVEGQAGELPNVYLLIFDEYANFPQMEEFYDYDNAPLKEFLEENSFNISYASHNESILSTTIQTNMVNLDYIVTDLDVQSEVTYLRKNGLLFDLMREHGYQVQIYEAEDFYGGHLPGKGPKGTSFASTINGDDIRTLLFKSTVFYPLFGKKDIVRIGDYIEMANYIGTEAGKISNTFTLAYVALPHQPFLVDEFGRSLGVYDYMSAESWNDKSLYLGQFKYTTKLILSIIERICEDDPDAVIMLMSDHGARGTPGVTWEIMTNPLNALYYQGRELNIEGLSNVNTIRTVLNHLFGLDYEMVELPS